MATVRDVMTKDPRSLAANVTVVDAAATMKRDDIGNVIVLGDDNAVAGIVTDRDIVVRVVAENRDPSATQLREICSADVATVSPDDTVERAVNLMREHAVRRLPVVENGSPIGIVSIGDLAVDREPDSALADISATDPNK